MGQAGVNRRGEREYNKTVQIPSSTMSTRTMRSTEAEPHGDGHMDEMDACLMKHKAITGLGGTLTRPMRRSAISSDRMRPIASIPTRRDRVEGVGTVVVNDRIGRPLSSKPRRLGS